MTQMPKVIIPEPYLDRFQKLLNDLEEETGSMYQLTFHQFDHSDNQILGEFKTRQLGIEVYETDPKYSKLLGIYNSREALEDHLDELHNNEIFSEIKVGGNNSHFTHIGKCRKCGKFNDEKDKNNNHRPNYVTGRNNDMICQQCHHSFDTIWSYLRISSYNSTIFINAGRYAECITVAKYRFVNN